MVGSSLLQSANDLSRTRTWGAGPSGLVLLSPSVRLRLLGRVDISSLETAIPATDSQALRLEGPTTQKPPNKCRDKWCLKWNPSLLKSRVRESFTGESATRRQGERQGIYSLHLDGVPTDHACP